MMAAATLQPGPNRTFVSRSPAMRELLSTVARVAWSEEPVLIQGETGAGKEVIARELHALSPRADQPLLKVNCAALPSELVESELFGYERGAFTGAFQRKPGIFELADGGALLLDEIGDMDYRLQAKLLQVLQDQEFHRLGGRETVRVNVRVIAATHNELEQSIPAGRFRADLYYRINVINLRVPPLRDRQQDIVPLAEFLLWKHCGNLQPRPVLTLSLRQALEAYDWPGNVRELENSMRKLKVLSDPEALAREFQAARARRSGPALPVRPGPQAASPMLLEEVGMVQRQTELETILSALNASFWNRKKAAAMLGTGYKSLLYRMKRLGLDGRNGKGGAPKARGAAV
jgi:transcriptional regulator with GAF, ATPase, and Fis domain